MNVLLIQPPSCDPMTDQVFMFEPLALEYLGAGLKLDGHKVRLLDARIEPDIDGVFDRFRPDVVGLTGYTSHVNIIKTIARRLKERAPDTLVVVGGHHATVRPADFNEPCIDAVVIGDKRPYLVCLVMIDQDNVEKYAQDNDIPFSNYASLTRAPEVMRLIEAEVARVNKEFARVEQIKAFRLIEQRLSAEDEELTPTMKLKRSLVSRKYAELIETMYR